MALTRSHARSVVGLPKTWSMSNSDSIGAKPEALASARHWAMEVVGEMGMCGVNASEAQRTGLSGQAVVYDEI